MCKTCSMHSSGRRHLVSSACSTAHSVETGRQQCNRLFAHHQEAWCSGRGILARTCTSRQQGRLLVCAATAVAATGEVPACRDCSQRKCAPARTSATATRASAGCDTAAPAQGSQSPASEHRRQARGSSSSISTPCGARRLLSCRWWRCCCCRHAAAQHAHTQPGLFTHSIISNTHLP